MKTRITFSLSLLVMFALLLSGCAPKANIDTQPTPTKGQTDNNANMANPAAVFCEGKGYHVEIRTASDGSQYGICIFPDGSECDEWAFFRNECAPGTQAPTVEPPAPETTPAVDSRTENKAVEAVRSMLAKQLKVDPSQITLLSLEAINWPNGCLGISNPGQMCTQVITPGFRIILTVGSDHYTYHTDLTGSVIRQETAGTKPGN